MFSAIGIAGNDGETRRFAKGKTHILHRWKRGRAGEVHRLFTFSKCVF